MKLNKPLRQFLVNLILSCWMFMPIRLKVWAFMNDGDLIDDCEFDNKKQ